MEYTHGGDWAGFLAENGCLPRDFSANTSPFGVPAAVAKAVNSSMLEAGRYPDPHCRALRRALGQHHDLPMDWVLCGNGAADLIYRLALAKQPRRAMVTAPTFSEYENALALTGCQVVHHLLREEDGFAVTERILEDITPGLDLLFLCEPGNPTGRTTDPALLLRILEQCAACGTLLVLDECFNEFLEDPAVHTLTGQLGKYGNLLILRAFTKCYGMAGIRLGYALCSDTAFLDKMAASGPPWAVSGPAQAGGMAALRSTDYLAHLQENTRTQRPLMLLGLTALGCKVIPGEVNYLLFYHEDHTLADRLAKRGFLLRRCDNYKGLGPGWLRTAIRAPRENLALLEAMKEVLG